MTDTIMLEAPARGGRISDLADGQGRILRLHDLTASSLGHTSHANQTESPTRTGGRVTIERKPDEGDGPAVIHRLNDERDQRWQNLIVGFLIHASRGIVRHDGQHEYTAVPDAPWRTSAPYASSLSGAADNRWGGRDKRKDIIIASAVIAVTFSCAGSLACYRMKKSLHTYHENNAVLENELDAADYQNIMGCPHPWKTF